MFGTINFQLQGLLRSFYQRFKGYLKLDIATEEAVADYFLVVGHQHAACFSKRFLLAGCGFLGGDGGSFG
jgi:hypothetical protein